MKIAIDIHESIYKHFMNNKYIREDIIAVHTAIVNGTPLDNVTNGDVIKMMFPNADIVDSNTRVYMIFDMRRNGIYFDLDWWNEPYKAESEE